jgi:uncharacterized membrane protein/predicted DsbA family dithiol-disulfide isomerase
MTGSRWLLLAQLCIFTALCASAALYVHYLDPANSAFCGMHSGCEAVRRSAISYFGRRELSLPLFGLVAYASLFALSIAPAKAARDPERGPWFWLFVLSGVGASAGVALLAYQFLGLGQLCWLCVIVDVCALLTALCAFFVLRAARSGEAPQSPLKAWAAAGLALLVVLAPFGWSRLKAPPPVPAKVASLYRPDKINVVEFADFECPFCRRLHATLKPLLAEYGERVNFVRVQYPLEQHEMAQPAARAALCAQAAGKGEPMADKLFSIELSPDNIARAAEALGFERHAFAGCMASDFISRTLAEQRAYLPAEEFKGLPTTYVGDKAFLGAWPEVTFRDAFERAQRERPWAPSGPIYVAGLLLAGAVLAFAGRRVTLAHGSPS